MIELDGLTGYVSDLTRRLRTCFEHIRGADADTVEMVHDFRVTSRRLAEPLMLMQRWLGRKEPRRARKRLRTLRNSFRRVRDLDVLLVALTGGSGCEPVPMADLDRLVKALTGLRAKAVSKAVRAAAHRQPARIARDVDGLLKAFVERARGREEAVAADVVAMVRDRATDLINADPRRTPTRDLHDVRIRAKRLRYAARVIDESKLCDVQALATQLRETQELLGEWNDHVVAGRTIGLLAARRRHLNARPPWAASLFDYAAWRARSADVVRAKIAETWPATEAAVQAAIDALPVIAPPDTSDDDTHRYVVVDAAADKVWVDSTSTKKRRR